MKTLTIFLIASIISGCNSSSTIKTENNVNHSVEVKIANIQICLDSISKSKEYDILKGDKFILVRDDHYTVGLENLYFGENKIQLQNVLLKKRTDYDSLKKDVNKMYIKIKYLPMSENNLTIVIYLLNLNERYTYYLLKQGNNWIIKKTDLTVN